MRIKYCEKTKNKIENIFSITPKASYIGEIALKSILLELSATPKPGLVDRNDNGSS